MRNPTGYARVSSTKPVGFALCDRCGMLYNHPDLRWEMEYRGMNLQPTGFLVCPSCLDTPQPERRPIIIPPDPVSVLGPRVQDYTPSRDDYIATEISLNEISTETDVPLVVQETLDIDDMT